jgi:hypothetical protein
MTGRGRPRRSPSESRPYGGRQPWAIVRDTIVTIDSSVSTQIVTAPSKVVRGSRP